jgi:hypothetical protein
MKAKNSQVDRVVQRTAVAVSAALDKMIDDLPQDAAPQMVIGLVMGELAHLQPWLLRLIMEDTDIREAYDAAVATIPANARGRSP